MTHQRMHHMFHHLLGCRLLGMSPQDRDAIKGALPNIEVCTNVLVKHVHHMRYEKSNGVDDCKRFMIMVSDEKAHKRELQQLDGVIFSSEAAFDKLA